MEASIALKDISKRYPSGPALDSVTFGVERHTIFGIVGPAGAGKSTLLQILTTLITSDTGTVFIHGIPLHEQPGYIRSLSGYVPEQEMLNPDGTVFENLKLHGLLYGLSPQKATVRSRKLLEQFDLLEYAHDFPDSLPVSLRRLVSFARALVSDPDLLYLDEPVMRSDYRTRSLIWEYLHTQAGDKTVCFTTMSISEAEEHADRYIVLHQGRVLTDRLHEDIRNIIQRDTEYLLEFHPPHRRPKELLRDMEGVIALEEWDSRVSFHLERATDFLEVIRKIGVDTIRDLRVKEPDLNRIILDLTKEDIYE